jgi:cytochrome c biogenesis protein CcmG/thiol:disulfide interchange protein DsbE
VAVAVVGFVFNGRFGEDPRLVGLPLVGRPLPDSTLPYLEQDGGLTLSGLRGQTLVINFWASWCFPCRLEHPTLTEASAAYESRNVHFVGVVHQDNEASAVSFLDELGRGASYSYVTDEDSRFAVEMGLFGLPETYFVDADGIIRGRIQGEVSPTSLVSAIEDLLAGRDVGE